MAEPLVMAPAAPRAEIAAPILEIKDLRVQFQTDSGTVAAVNDVSLSLTPGEILTSGPWSSAARVWSGSATSGSYARRVGAAWAWSTRPSRSRWDDGWP